MIKGKVYVVGYTTKKAALENCRNYQEVFDIPDIGVKPDVIDLAELVIPKVLEIIKEEFDLTQILADVLKESVDEVLTVEDDIKTVIHKPKNGSTYNKKSSR